MTWISQCLYIVVMSTCSNSQKTASILNFKDFVGSGFRTNPIFLALFRYFTRYITALECDCFGSVEKRAHWCTAYAISGQLIELSYEIKSPHVLLYVGFFVKYDWTSLECVNICIVSLIVPCP